MSSVLLKSKQMLEQNEDFMAAIVENLQIGRISDCAQFYSLLHKNLMSLAHELDNYPTIEQDAFASLHVFPDEIMRRDILDDIRPAGDIVLPKLPILPPCSDCVKNKVLLLSVDRHVSGPALTCVTVQRTDYECREVYGHVQPSFKYTATENEEFVHATEVLGERHRNFIIEKMAGKSKRLYRRWSNSDKFNLMVAIAIVGPKETYRIADLLGDRSENQVLGFDNEISYPYVVILSHAVRFEVSYARTLMQTSFKNSAKANCHQSRLCTSHLHAWRYYSPIQRRRLGSRDLITIWTN
jgi:hypothetical protein